jgi:hypothetical protein
MVAKVVMILSVQLYCLTAARTPIGTANTIVISSALPIRARVAGMRCMYFAKTGWPSR